jgi:glycosyltransferase involved in cell wall biosynthesis
MKTVLIVAYYFPPIAASGGIRPLGFCRYLTEYGWLPRVLTTDADSVYPEQGIDGSLYHGLPGQMRVDRVAHTSPLRAFFRARGRVRELIRAFARTRKQPSPLDGRNHDQSAAPQASTIKDLVLDWAFSFPDLQCSWRRPAVRWVSRLAKTERPDVILATGAPWTSLLVGRDLAERFGIPFVADFRDPWMMDPNYHKRYSSTFLLKKGKALEHSVCTAAARVITNTEELRRKFREVYPELKDKFVTITNGFDQDSSSLAKHADTDMNENSGSHSSDVDREGLELCHFGTIYMNRTPVRLFQAIAELFKDNKLRPNQLRMRFVGAWDVMDDYSQDLARELEKHGFLRREAPIPRQMCLRQMVCAKALLVLQPDYPLQIPAKIYEYVAAGRPIFVIGGEGATFRLVKQYRLGLCCSNQVRDIKRLLGQLVSGKIRLESPDPFDISRFTYRSLAGELGSVLNAACFESSRQPQSR